MVFSGLDWRHEITSLPGTVEQPVSERKVSNWRSCSGALKGRTERDVAAPESWITLWKGGETPSL